MKICVSVAIRCLLWHPHAAVYAPHKLWLSFAAMIAALLLPFRAALGHNYQPYCNHATRVYHIALAMRSLDAIATEKLAIACAFHDLGIWTANTWDYLQPSEELCAAYLRQNGKADWTEEILQMIHQHHKLLPYAGPHQPMVELFRKADLVDFSQGIIRFSCSKQHYRQLVIDHPYLGFHGILMQQFMHHMKQRPWNPFPMLKL